jgi:DNA-binding MarR family transcriptional regulator
VKRHMVRQRKLRYPEISILRCLEEWHRPMNTVEIAKDNGMSWRTARRLLKRLEEEGYVESWDKGNMIMWHLKSK